MPLRDEVVPDAPWIIDRAWIKKHKIDLVVHGDDYSQENELRLQWDVITFSISWDDAGYAIESSSFIGALSAFVVAGLLVLFTMVLVIRERTPFSRAFKLGIKPLESIDFETCRTMLFIHGGNTHERLLF